MTKAEMPLIRKKPAFEQPTLQLPLPAPYSTDQVRQEEPTVSRKEDVTERGVWTTDI